MEKPEQSNCTHAGKLSCPFATLLDLNHSTGVELDPADFITQLDELLRMVEVLRSQCIEKLQNLNPVKLPTTKTETP